MGSLGANNDKNVLKYLLDFEFMFLSFYKIIALFLSKKLDTDGFSSKKANRTSIRFPLPMSKESDYDNSLKSAERKAKKNKRCLRKTNDYQIHYPISSTDSSAINSPAITVSRKKYEPFITKNYLNNSQNLFGSDKKTFKDFDSLCDINSQTESLFGPFRILKKK
ncbi:hypothetical protein BpHYR1_024246 [Brachionus plicatilis]|uniref:Uncharacterized protein n=1 Tax=Brachionus plicatilis TaxID=10195 RepID=A0A3M7RTR0_BRAPC|nr:hypothetical protein BpHYR1_024246 [Brachionus plicatilis]